MDLCLRGSQINLVERQKPRPKYSSQTNLYQPSNGNNPNNYNTRARPRSAQFFTKRCRSSPFLNRPQSAELSQFGAGAGVGAASFGCGRSASGNCGQYRGRGGEYVREKSGKSGRYQSISSSSLLKLLLDEPIKRSWLCRGGVSSPETQSEESSARKHTSAYFDYNNRTRAETRREGSAESVIHQKVGIENNRFTMSTSASRLSSGNSVSSFSREKSAGSTASTSSLRATDYWHTNTTTTHTSMLQKEAKTDLPGRVSFSKPNVGMQYEPELSLSDGESNNQKPQEFTATPKNSPNNTSISEPGPVTLPAAVSFNSKPEFAAPALPCGELSTSAGAKKSVHFGASAGGEGILAETYEYPKCPSENCSCSTRSSSTASSTQDVGAEGKCTCDSPTCKLSAERMLRRSSLTDIDDNMDFTPKNQLQKKNSVTEELQVIRDYKSVVGDQLENSVVKQILEEDKTKFGSYDNSNNTLEMPTYLDKYVSPTKSNVYSDKPNNLSEAKPSTNFKNGAKKNFVGSTANELNKMDNNLENNFKSQATYAPTSDTVINNYLKVAATTPLMIKKKENNRPNSGEKPVQNNENQSVIVVPKNQATHSKSNGNAKIKKATSFGSLREDSNLTEFNLDKVDSWMSMHGESMNQRQTLSKHKSLDADFEKFTGGELDEDGHREHIERYGDDRADSASQVSTRSDGESTYDEIVSVIKEIDEDKKKDNYAERAANELELKLNTTPDIVNLPSSGEKTAETSKSPDKYKDILSYLDTVEDSCDRTLLETRRSIPETNRSEVEFVVEPDIAEDVPKLADLLMLPNHQLARRVIALSLRANELANAVYLSKEHVMKVRTDKQKGIRTEKANSANRLREQKKHYEAIVKRHQGFIEQLLKDKGSLCEKVAALTRRLESQNQAWEHKLETEVARVKETTLAGEKIRRERWVRENTKKIKELTVKGLEAEINKMTCNHQRETTELKQAHQQQLLDALEEARLKHEQIENSIRESCAQDRESIIEKERLAIRERFERQLEEERKCFDEQRQKLVEDFNAERARLQNELKLKDADFQVRRQELQREKESELEQTVAELQEKMFKQEEKYQNRINTIEKQYEADFELWKRDYENECKVSHVEKENAIRQHYRAERDRQIDAIVSRMDAEALKHAEEHDAKLDRLKEKYEKDLQLVENAERSLREKYADTRSSLAEADAKVRNSEAEIKQLKMELEHSKKMCNDFLADRDQLRDNLRNEVQSEVAVIKSERDSEIQKIHKRVQQAIEKKDATIDLLQKENGSLRERCLKLEAVIRQQRKDYCVK